MRARGFSLIECTFALLLLAGGLLAVATTARAANRLAMLAARTSAAGEIAVSRLARLEAAGCGAASGAAVSGAYGEAWAVTAARGLRRVTLTVSTTHEGRPLSWDFRAAVLCRAELP